MHYICTVVTSTRLLDLEVKAQSGLADIVDFLVRVGHYFLPKILKFCYKAKRWVTGEVFCQDDKIPPVIHR
jgi:hypothetical protein